MRLYAISLFVVLLASVVFLSWQGVAALDEVSSRETLEGILSGISGIQEGNAENLIRTLEETGRLAANHLIFGERVKQRLVFQVASLGLLICGILGACCA